MYSILATPCSSAHMSCNDDEGDVKCLFALDALSIPRKAVSALYRTPFEVEEGTCDRINVLIDPEWLERLSAPATRARVEFRSVVAGAHYGMPTHVWFRRTWKLTLVKSGVDAEDLLVEEDRPFDLTEVAVRAGGSFSLSVSPQSVSADRRDDDEDDHGHKLVLSCMVVLAHRISVDELVLYMTRSTSESRFTLSRLTDCLHNYVGVEHVYGEDRSVPRRIFVRLSLSDPASGALLRSPARGAFCTHITCFDVRVALQRLEGRPVNGLQCPLCRKWHLLSEIYIDRVFVRIVEQIPAKSRPYVTMADVTTHDSEAGADSVLGVLFPDMMSKEERSDHNRWIVESESV